MRRLASAIVALGLLVAGSARAEFTPPPMPPGAGVPVAPPRGDPTLGPEPPQTRLIANHLLALRYNPLGLEYQLRAGVQRRAK